MRQLELGWDTNSDRERNAMVTPRHLALASWGEREQGKALAQRTATVSKRWRESQKVHREPAIRLLEFRTFLYLDLEARCWRRKQSEMKRHVESCKQEIRFGLRSPFRLRLMRNELEFSAWH